MNREELIVEALASGVHEEDGWLSDAQTARLEWDADNRAVRFHGEGSIDLAHLAGIVSSVFEQAHTETDDEMRAEVERVQKAAWAEIHGQDPMRKYSVAEVKQLVYSFDNVLGSLLARTVQGEPTDAQVKAGLDAFFKCDFYAEYPNSVRYHEPSMRAALRAAAEAS